MGSGWRNAVAAIGVVVGLAALVGVPAAVDAVLPEEGPLPPGDRLDVGYGVSLRPPPGARLELGTSRPGMGEVALRSGGMTLRVTAVEVRERPADFVAHARRKFSRDEGLNPGQPEEVSTAAGVPGQRGDLRAAAPTGEAGCYGIFTADEAGAVAVISAVDGCAAVPADLWAAVASLTFEPAEEW